MKSTILVLAALIVGTTLFSQEGIDYMGIPTKKISPVINQNANLKNTNALISPVLKQFPSPSTLPTSIGFYNGYLWVIGYNDYLIYKVCPNTGVVLGTIPISIQKPYGITFHNGNIYVLDNINKKIFGYTETGLVVETIDLTPISSPTYLTGLCSANDEFWFNDTKGPNPSATNDSIFALNEQLIISQGFESVGTFPSGITYDGNYLWVNDNPTQTTNKIDPITHAVLKTYTTPGGAYPNGVAYDGEGLWIINNATDSIYFLIPEEMTSVGPSLSAHQNNINSYTSGKQIYFNYQPEWIGSEVVIFDCSSRMIASKQIPSGDNFIWDTSIEGINNGFYLICIYNNSQKFTKKIILNNY